MVDSILFDGRSTETDSKESTLENQRPGHIGETMSLLFAGIRLGGKRNDFCAITEAQSPSQTENPPTETAILLQQWREGYCRWLEIWVVRFSVV